MPVWLLAWPGGYDLARRKCRPLAPGDLLADGEGSVGEAERAFFCRTCCSEARGTRRSIVLDPHLLGHIRIVAHFVFMAGLSVRKAGQTAAGQLLMVALSVR